MKRSFEFEIKKGYARLESQFDNTFFGSDPSNLERDQKIHATSEQQKEIRNKIAKINHMVASTDLPLNTIKRIYHDAIATEKIQHY